MSSWPETGKSFFTFYFLVEFNGFLLLYLLQNGGYSKTEQVTYKAGVCPISGAQLGTLRLALKAANKDGNLGAKVGLRYNIQNEFKCEIPFKIVISVVH
jgi:hypothetical protein